MIEIQLKAENQRLKRTDKESIVGYSKNIIKAKFTIEGDIWKDVDKFAIFTDAFDNKTTMHLGSESNCNCVVPSSCLKTSFFKITVYGGDLILTNAITIPLVESEYSRKHHSDYDDLSNTPTIPTVVDTVQDNNNNVVTSNAVYDALELKANAGHTHSTSEVLDPVAHPNIGTAANATQSTINMAVDNTIQSLLHVDMIVPVENKPTPNESTMNKLYLVPETDPQTDDEYQVWCTIRSGTEGNYQYAWKKLDPVRLDLSGYVRKSDVSLAIENDEIVLNLG